MLSHYFNEAKLYLYIQLNSFAHVCDRQIGSVSLVSCVLFIVLLWVIIYLLYKKVIGVTLKRMALPVIIRSRLMESIWDAGFCISSIPLCITKLFSQSDGKSGIIHVISYNLFITEKTVPTHILLSYIIVSSFYIHKTCLVTIQKGFNADLFINGLVVIILYTSYLLRYVSVGLSLIALISISTLWVELTRISYNLNWGRRKKIGCWRVFIYFLFMLHCLLWGCVFLYILPQYYLMPVVNVHVSEENLMSVAVLSAAMWSYFWLNIFCAPIFKLAKFLIRPDYTYGQRDWLDYVLFPPSNDVLQHLRMIRSKVQQEKSFLPQHALSEDRNSEDEMKRSNNSAAALYQTVKCVMAMKRRIKRKREAKAQAASTSQEPGTASTSQEPRSSTDSSEQENT